VVLRQQARRLRGGEREVAAADLGEPAGQPVPVQRQRRIPAAHQHEAQPLVRVAQHELQVGRPQPAGQLRDAVEHQHDRPRLVAQGGREAAEHRPVDGVRRDEWGELGERRLGAPQGLDQVGPEGRRLVVLALQGDPGDRLAAARPAAQDATS